MYTLLLAIIYLTFISLGLPDSLLGAGWPAMHETLDVPASFMGIVTMVISGCTIVSSLLSARLTKAFSTRAVIVVSVFLTALALFGFSFSSQFWMLIVFALPYGFGAGAIDASLNHYVAIHYAPKHMSWLHCFWGVGTIISPLLMGYALSIANWEAGYQMVGGIQLCIAIVLLVTLPLWKVNKGAVEEQSENVGLIAALKIKGVPLLLLGFFAYCAGEATTMMWASTYMVEVKGITPELAAWFASLFFIGITVGRFFGGFLMERLGDRKMIVIGTCILACGIVCLVVPGVSSVFTLAGFVIIGFGCAPIYPCIIHAAPHYFSTENSGAIIGIQMAGAYTGSTFMPPLYGLLGSSIGFWILPYYLAIWAILMIAMTEAAFRLAAKGHRNSDAS